jgi:hypothetical protein
MSDDPTDHDRGAAMLDELERLHEALATQDNAITSDPIFLVQQKRRHIGFDSSYEEDEDRIIWVNGAAEEDVTRASDPERFARFQAGEFGDEDEEDWEAFGFTESWEFVQPFLTRDAAEEFRRREAHNLGETRIYVESGHRNPEWKRLRALFGGELVAQARLASELTALLCTEAGQDVVERAKASAEDAARWRADYHAACNEMAKARGQAQDAISRFDWLAFDRDEEAENRGGQFARLWSGLKAAVKRAEELEGANLLNRNAVRLAKEETASLRAALAEKDARIENLLHLYETTMTCHEEAANLAHARGIENEKLRAEVAELKEQAEMACVEPRDDCDCHGCSYAAEVHAKGETKAKALAEALK